MKTVSNPHDRFFRQLLQNKDVARDFFEYYLPEGIVQNLDLSTAEIQKDSFIEKDLKTSYSDILYRVEMAGKPGYIYFLFEHKSYPDRFTALQLLGYMVGIWKLHIRQNSKEPLPLIVPMVIYHSMEIWRHGNRFSCVMADVAEDATRYVPDFEFLLYDLPRLPDEKIRGDTKLRIGLLLMKYIRDPEIARHLAEMFSQLKDLIGSERFNEYVEMIFRYLLCVVEVMSADHLKTIVDGTLSEKMGGELMTIAEKLRKEGYDQGIEKGIQTGIEKGIQTGIEKGIQTGIEKGIQTGIEKGIQQGALLSTRVAVIDVLEARFGVLPDDIRQFIDAMDDLDRLNSLHRSAVIVPDLDRFYSLLK